MEKFLGCELCQRAGVEAVGITHLGLHHYEACAECRQIVVEARRRIAMLKEPLSDNYCRSCGKADGIIECRNMNGEMYRSCLFCVQPQPSITVWARDGQWEYLKFCPRCGSDETGLGSCDGRPGCNRCLREFRKDEIRQVGPPWTALATTPYVP